uniref:VIT domain-containing protein n=1 Tax=Meleagris gallopavo TaxID=9103 RepID=A0A803XL12_MELGA
MRPLPVCRSPEMWHQSFGLLGKSDINEPGSFLLGKEFYVPLCSLPLCSAVVDVAIQDYVADVVSELIYHNESLRSSEVTFVFPLDPHMAIYSFQACSEDAKVKAVLQDETQWLHKATAEKENFHYLQYGVEKSGEVFACFLGSLSPGKEMVVTLHYVQELSRKPDGAAQFVLPSTMHPYKTHYTCNCRTDKLHYSLLLTVSLQSPRGVADVQANCALTPLIYTAQDHSAAQVSLAGTPPNHHLELLVYYREPTAVSAVVEKGNPAATAGSLFGDSLVLVTLAPNIPDAKPGLCQSGEFIFVLDSSSLEHTQDPMLFLLKSLPLGCYFNIYCYGGTSEGIYPQSVEYTQDNLNEAMQHIPTTGSRLGDTDLLGTLRTIYNTPRPCGHARQLFIFMSGLPPDKEAIVAEVCRHRNSHRCFSFCFSTDSATLATALARETKGEAIYVSSDNAIVQVLKCLKQALKPVAEGVSLDWTLPSGLEVEVLGGTPQFIFQSQHIFLYAQIHGKEKNMKEASGVMTLQFSLDGQVLTHKIQFPLCPQGDGRFHTPCQTGRELSCPSTVSFPLLNPHGQDPGWLVIVWLQDICWRSCCQRLQVDQGMNQCNVPLKSVSHLGSSAPSPAMWVFVHHGGPPGTMGPWHCCHLASHLFPARSFCYVAPSMVLPAFLRPYGTHLAGTLHCRSHGLPSSNSPMALLTYSSKGLTKKHPNRCHHQFPLSSMWIQRDLFCALQFLGRG